MWYFPQEISSEHCKALVMEEMKDEAEDIRLQPAQQEVLVKTNLRQTIGIDVGCSSVSDRLR